MSILLACERDEQVMRFERLRRRTPFLLLGYAVFLIVYTTISMAVAQPAVTASCRAIDGDTIRCPGIEEAIRIQGVDTPEIFTVEQCAAKADTRAVLWQGYAAQGRLQRLMNGREVALQLEDKLDKYRRRLARVFVGGDDVAHILIHDGFGRPYDCPANRCESRRPWCPEKQP